MLSRNDVVFKPKQGDFEKFKKNPVFKLANRLINTNPNPKNRRKDVPRSFSIEPFYTYTDPKTNETFELRYFEHKVNKKSGGDSYSEYTPSEIEFGQSAELRIAPSETDLWWFLHHHPRQASSPYRDSGKAVFFYLEDKAEQARGKATKSRMAAHAIGMIWGEDALSEKEAKRLLQSYNVPKVDELIDEQVRLDLEKRAKKDPGIFLEKSSGASMNTRATVQRAVDNGIIKYSEKKQGWFYVREDGMLGGLIVAVPNAAKQYDAINDFLKETDTSDNLGYLEKMIAEKEKEKGVLTCPHCDDFETDSQQKLDKHIVSDHPTSKKKDADKSNKDNVGELATSDS